MFVTTTMLLLPSALAVAQPMRCEVINGRVDVVLPPDLSREVKYLAVVRNGNWYPIVDDQNKPAAFSAPSGRVSLSIARQRAIDYRDGKTAEVAAFPRKGTYKLVFSDNLETEPENMASVTCPITIGR